VGLKENIAAAFIKNLQPTETGGNFDFSDKAIDKIDVLAEDLTTAIITFIQAQTFTVTKLKMTSVGNTTTPAVLGAPSAIIGADGVPGKMFVEMAGTEEGVATTNPLSAVESNVSKVQLKTIASGTDREIA
jgi:hypothetical protein|tara:strand:+ start:32 stop:424 length:393 start_codon:yes stop_codon:yes gene_type:complete